MDKLEKHEKQVAEELVGTQYYEKKQTDPVHKKSFRLPDNLGKRIIQLIISIGAVTSFVLAASVASDYFSLIQSRRDKSIEWLPRTPVPTQIIQITPDPVLETASTSAEPTYQIGTSKEIYKVIFTASSSFKSTQQIREVLLQTLKIDSVVDDTVTFALFYNTQTYPDGILTEARFNSSYVLLVNDGLIKKGEYNFDGGKIVIEATDMAALQFIEDVKFCNQDTDCQIRGNFCTYGAFNNYQSYKEDWSCAGAPVSEQDEEFGVFSDQLSCVTQLEFDSVSCNQNRCEGVNKQIVCQR